MSSHIVIQCVWRKELTNTEENISDHVREGVRFVITANSKDSVIGCDNSNGNMRAWRARCTIYVPQPIAVTMVALHQMYPSNKELSEKRGFTMVKWDWRSGERNLAKCR